MYFIQKMSKYVKAKNKLLLIALKTVFILCDILNKSQNTKQQKPKAESVLKSLVLEGEKSLIRWYLKTNNKSYIVLILHNTIIRKYICYIQKVIKIYINLYFHHVTLTTQNKLKDENLQYQ